MAASLLGYDEVVVVFALADAFRRHLVEGDVFIVGLGSVGKGGACAVHRTLDRAFPG
ncbi:hypothetical protein SAMN06296065_105242 [Novosphingobium panipatense]|uniref:Uncharacterized protein n=1 Tax=Novosphingobium panipatense TaxID=428991 RepID=A0ABY1QK03_9SPHN|nr:hypothetical protein SAMN06296065_105242 [Novosphingobium panipatense]